MSQHADAVCQSRELLKQLLGLHLMAQQQLLIYQWYCQSWMIAVTITGQQGQQETTPQDRLAALCESSS
jgi:hypothetical protein